MSISTVVVKCPACGAELNVNSDREFSFCSYCGSKIMLNNENEHIYRSIDEARIKEAEIEKMIRLKELEMEEQENARKRKSLAISFAIALAFIIVGGLICLANPTFGAFGVVIGVYIGLFTYIKSDEKNKKKKNFVGTNEVRISEAMEDYGDKNFVSLALLFRSGGFTNVTEVPLKDLSVFSMSKNGRVESVTINGSDDFEEGDIFPKNSNVIITYHSKG